MSETAQTNLTCHLCGCDVREASARGAYHARVNAKGVPGIWECRPSCDGKHGNQNDALLAALEETK